MNLISELMRGKISKEKFLEKNNITQIDKVIMDGLNTAYAEKNADSVDELLYLTFLFEMFKAEYVDVLHQLLISKWHYRHEDIVLLLEKISCIESIDYLYNAIELHPDYLALDDNYAFEVKCVRAIYYIGRERAYSYLEHLCEHENNTIRAMAQRQIKKLG